MIGVTDYITLVSKQDMHTPTQLMCYHTLLTFILSYKANAKVKPTKMGHGPHSS
jgi:hypothetical protein